MLLMDFSSKKYQPALQPQPKNKLIKKVSEIKMKESFFLNQVPAIPENFQQQEEKKPIISTESMESVLEIPAEIQLTIREIGRGKFLNFQTDRGTLNMKWPEEFPLAIKQQENRQELHLVCPEPQKFSDFSVALRAVHQILVGVAKGYKKKLKLVGVGYKAFLEADNKLKVNLGYSHANYHSLDSTVGVKFNRKNTRFHLSGISLPAVSGTAATLHAWKKPDVYKGKGIRYKGIPLLKKEGKKKK